MTGRPTSYSEEMLAKAQHYLENYDSEEYGDQVPTVFGLVAVLKVSRSTIYKWGSDPELTAFSDTLEAINAKQAQVLCNKGLDGTYNATIAKLMLHNQGLSDKTDQTLSGVDGGPIETNVNLKVDWVSADNVEEDAD